MTMQVRVNRSWSFRRLTVRLFSAFVLTALVYIVASMHVVDFIWSTGYLSEMVTGHMALHVDYILHDLGSPPRLERAKAIVQAVPVDIRIVGPDMDWSSDSRFPPLKSIPFARSRFLRAASPMASDQQWSKAVANLEFARYQNRAYVRVPDGDYSLIFVSPKMAQTPKADPTTPAIGILAILVLGLCYAGVHWLIKPLQWIKDGARRIGEGDLDYRIPTRRKDDLGQLAADINRMADDVRDMLEAKRQLLLAISHELRSPLTRTKVALEFVNDETLKAGILADIQEMERLITDLLESERLQTRHSKLQVSDFDLVSLVQSAVAGDFQGRADEVRLLTPAEPLHLQGDVTRLRLLVKNLVDNALRYAQGKPVTVTLAGTPTEAALSVKDEGSGMSQSELARINEPFYRADPARSRATGGLGLGLYLCRRIAEAHGGCLEIQSAPGAGTQVTVRIPRKVPAQVQAA